MEIFILLEPISLIVLLQVVVLKVSLITVFSSEKSALSFIF